MISCTVLHGWQPDQDGTNLKGKEQVKQIEEQI